MPVRKRVVILLCGLAVVAGLLLVFRPTYGIRVAFDAEFHSRPDGYRGLCRFYGFEFPEEPRQMDPGLMYRVLADGAVDVIDAFATDGRIEAYDLLVLKDDKGYFPPYYAAPLVRRDTLQRHPELRDVLHRLAGRISDDTMRRLNYQVDGEGRKASDVARDFLVAEGLLAADARASDAPGGSITIGGKQFTEQEILGEIMGTLIECQTRLKVVRKLNLGGTMICFQALRAGDLDLYAEYTGTGLFDILQRDVESETPQNVVRDDPAAGAVKDILQGEAGSTADQSVSRNDRTDTGVRSMLRREVISDPDETFRLVKRAFEQEYGLIWLSPFGFNNTYTLSMRRSHAQELGIDTISDLANYMTRRSRR